MGKPPRARIPAKGAPAGRGRVAQSFGRKARGRLARGESVF